MIKRDSTQPVLALFPNVVRLDHASGDRRFASMLEIMEGSMGADLFMPGVNLPTGDPALAVLRNYFSGRIIADKWNGRPAFLAAKKYGACLLEFWWLAERALPVIRRCAPWMPVVVDSVDAHFLREASAVELGLMRAEMAAEHKQREIAIYQKADAVIAVTEEDKGGAASGRGDEAGPSHPEHRADASASGDAAPAGTPFRGGI